MFSVWKYKLSIKSLFEKKEFENLEDSDPLPKGLGIAVAARIDAFIKDNSDQSEMCADLAYIPMGLEGAELVGEFNDLLEELYDYADHYRILIS